MLHDIGLNPLQVFQMVKLQILIEHQMHVLPVLIRET